MHECVRHHIFIAQRPLLNHSLPTLPPTLPPTRRSSVTAGSEPGGSGCSILLGRGVTERDILPPALLLRLEANGNPTAAALRELHPVAELRMAELQSGGMKSVMKSAKVGRLCL